MSDSLNFATGPSQDVIGDLDLDSNLSTCYEAHNAADQLETGGKFTAAWIYRGYAFCTGSSMLYAVALSEDEQSAALCTYHFHGRNTDMGEQPIVDLRDDPEAHTIFLQLCGEVFASIKS